MAESERPLASVRRASRDALERSIARAAPPFASPAWPTAVLEQIGERTRPLAWTVTPVVLAVASRLWSAFWMLALIPAVRTTRGLPFTIWDSFWYLGVVRNGYHGNTVRGAHDFAFFPAWPSAIKLVSSVGLDPAVVGAVLANLLFVLAAVLIWRVFEQRFGSTVATGGVALLAFAPSAYAFSMAYSEPLFLVACGAYFALRDSQPRRGLLAGLAMLSRIAGSAVAASALVPLLRGSGARRKVAALTIASVVLVFAVWWLFIAHLTGRFTGFLMGSPAWVHGGNGAMRLLQAIRRPNPMRMAWIGFFGIVGLGALGLLVADLELAVFSLACLALAFLPGGLVSSMPRYALSAFPAFAGLAMRLGRRPTWALVLVFAFAQAWFVGWMIALPGGQAP